jgi:hypothetical protein
MSRCKRRVPVGYRSCLANPDTGGRESPAPGNRSESPDPAPHDDALHKVPRYCTCTEYGVCTVTSKASLAQVSVAAVADIVQYHPHLR